MNRLLAEANFDALLERWCRPHDAERMGRPSLPPGAYFRMILAGYFEGIASQRVAIGAENLTTSAPITTHSDS